MNEQELILELRLGNEAAFRWLVNHYRNRVYNTVLNILQQEAEAEDAAQETFIQVFESVGKFKEESSCRRVPQARGRGLLVVVDHLSLHDDSSLNSISFNKTGAILYF